MQKFKDHGGKKTSQDFTRMLDSNFCRDQYTLPVAKEEINAMSEFLDTVLTQKEQKLGLKDPVFRKLHP